MVVCKLDTPFAFSITWGPPNLGTVEWFLNVVGFGRVLGLGLGGTGGFLFCDTTDSGFLQTCKNNKTTCHIHQKII